MQRFNKGNRVRVNHMTDNAELQGFGIRCDYQILRTLSFIIKVANYNEYSKSYQYWCPCDTGGKNHYKKEEGWWFLEDMLERDDVLTGNRI